MLRIAPCLVVLSLLACDSDFPAQPDGAAIDAGARISPCVVGESVCVDGQLRTCLEDESGWLQTACDAGQRCMDGACVVQACAPGQRECVDDGVRTCDADGAAWGSAVACNAADVCRDGVCLPRSCAAGETACGMGVLLTCTPDGLSWDRAPCAADEICVDGACGPPGGACADGQVLCAEAEVWRCVDGAWGAEACPEREVCFAGACVACVRDVDCADGACVDGRCAPAPPRIVTDGLPVGALGIDYAVALEGAGGTPPYTWALVEGALPAGLGFDVEAGRIEGVPEVEGGFPLVIELRDSADVVARADFELRVAPPGLQITTEALPSGDEGEPYEAVLEAIGGMAPYGWFLVGGALPAGLVLAADGGIAGTPSEVGRFDLDVRVVDAATPPGFAQASFALEITVAPLRIVADQILDLFIARIITLPTITVIPGIPVPYDTRLEARGGLRPHTWAEDQLPAAARPLLPMAGIPDGLVLEEDGRLHGAVDSLDQAVEVPIPFTEIVLRGFFFFAEVRDSQRPADRDSAIFLLPTLAVGQ